MGLFGKKTDRDQPQTESLSTIFAIVNATRDLFKRLQMQPTGVSACCFRQPLTSLPSEIGAELLSLLAVSQESSGTKYHVLEDDFGFGWVIVQDSDFKALVEVLYLTALTFVENNLSDRLLVAIFPFTYNDTKVQWIYSFTRNRFYPCIPVNDKDRDSILEFELSSTVEGLLPIEEELEHWYGIWCAPLSGI